MMKQLRIAILMVGIFTVTTGLLYPLVVTGIAQLCFPHASNGSMIENAGTTVGSEFIGQPFDAGKYFWSRPSAAGAFSYNAVASSGSNYGPLNPALSDEVRKRIDALHAADSTNHQLVPVDLVTSSGSGLDPHISVAAALYQLPRVARNRAMTEESVRSILDQFSEGRQFGFLGEPRVNVLKLNLALDEYQSGLKVH